MASVREVYGDRQISEAQRLRLFAIAFGTKEHPGALQGTKRERLNQLDEMLGKFGYDWGGVDENTPRYWIKQRDYEELIEQLLVLKGEI